jgi:hypothetical protein
MNGWYRRCTRKYKGDFMEPEIYENELPVNHEKIIAESPLWNGLDQWLEGEIYE